MNPHDDRPCEDQFHDALRVYEDALHNARSLLTPARFERGIELRHVKRMVQPLVDAAAAREPATVGLAWVSQADEAWAHGVHVCLVTVGMGHHLGLDRGALADLGVAALLHDVGVKTIACSTTLNRTSLCAMRVALEHHACGTVGYPGFSVGQKPMAASRLVAVADAFVSLLSVQGERGERITPYEALGLVLGPVGVGFDDVLKAALVRTVGVYPPGQVVELDDHVLARAMMPSNEDPERPMIELLTTPEGAHLMPSEWLLGPMRVERSILRALPIDEWPDSMGGSVAA